MFDGEEANYVYRIAQSAVNRVDSEYPHEFLLKVLSAHAASSALASPHPDCAVLVVDGRGIYVSAIGPFNTEDVVFKISDQLARQQD
ncbi:hypothetical protein H7H51_27705 [Mycolicibacterium farcinogenes]|nr:hypothetical protein [Mycolicibacterium farcinogenes]